VALGGGLAAAVLGPVHARGYQFDGGGIDDVDGTAKTVGDALAAASPRETGRERLEMAEHLPEDFLRNRRAPLARVRESVAARLHRAADGRKRPAVEPHCVALVVKADAVG